MKRMIMALLCVGIAITGCQGNDATETKVTTQAFAPLEDEVLAGTKSDAGLYFANYIRIEEKEYLSDYYFDAKNNLVLVLTDSEGTHKKLRVYNIKTGEETKLQKVKRTSTEIKDKTPTYLKNQYVGERLISKGSSAGSSSDIDISYNEEQGSRTDGMARLYKAHKLLYCGNEVKGSGGIISDSSGDGRYGLIGFQTGDVVSGEKPKTAFYLADTTQMSEKKDDSADLSDTKGLIQKMADSYGITVKVLTNQIKSQDKVEAKIVTGDEAEYVAKVYTMFSYFPEAFYKEFAKKQKESGYENFTVYITGTIQSPENSFVPSGLAYPDHILLDATLDPGQLVYLAAHEFMHVLDTYMASKSGTLDEWNKYLPSDFSYQENYDNADDNTEYTLQDPKASKSNIYFVSNYGLVNQQEDSATLFQTMFSNLQDDRYLVTHYPNLKKRMKYLSQLLRKTYTTLDTKEVWQWEKNLN